MLITLTHVDDVFLICRFDAPAQANERVNGRKDGQKRKLLVCLLPKRAEKQPREAIVVGDELASSATEAEHVCAVR